MDMLEFGRKILATQPFNELVGAELIGGAVGRADIRVPVRANLAQQHGSVHGGVLSYAADNALTFAGGSVLGVAVVTSEFKINYLRPAVGDYLIARAKVVHHGGRQAVCVCEIFASQNGEEILCALAQGTIVKMSKPA